MIQWFCDHQFAQAILNWVDEYDWWWCWKDYTKMRIEATGDIIIDTWFTMLRHYWERVFDVMTNYSTSWGTFFVMTNFLTSWRMFWRHNVFLTSWCTFWCHDNFCEVMTNILTSWKTFWCHNTLFDVMTYFLTPWYTFCTFWRHVILLDNLNTFWQYCLTSWWVFWSYAVLAWYKLFLMLWCPLWHDNVHLVVLFDIIIYFLMS